MGIVEFKNISYFVLSFGGKIPYLKASLFYQLYQIVLIKDRDSQWAA